MLALTVSVNLPVKSDLRIEVPVKELLPYRASDFAPAPDNTPPVAGWNITNNATGVAIDVIPTVTFNEPVRHQNNDEITNTSVDAIISFTKVSSGSAVAFNASINAGKTQITIPPNVALEFDTLYSITIQPVLEDDSDNSMISASSVTFRTITENQPGIGEAAIGTTFKVS